MRRSLFRLCAMSSFVVSFVLPISVYPAVSDMPVFIAQLPNPNDYTLFANNGWDGNWYVGYNNGWIKKLPAIPEGAYARAYIGAKLGRAKTLPPVGRPPVFNPVPGQFWMALSDKPSWNKSKPILIAEAEDIPLDGGAEFALDYTGESQWFWAEIPISEVHVKGDNYAVIWSTASAMLSVSSSPIIAGAWGGKDVNSWQAKDIQGAPPKANVALAAGISIFQPALALKLIPAGPAHPVRVRITDWKNGTPDHLKPVLSASVIGESIASAWVEAGLADQWGDVKRWIRIGRPLWKAPFVFSVEQEKLPHGRVRLRVAAKNVWEEVGYSESFEVEVSVAHATPSN